MNQLLKIQLRKYLPKEYQSNKDFDTFIDAISKSYDASEDQFSILQRAASIGSEELFNSNKQLKEESKSQKKIITKLNNLVKTLKIYDLEDSNNLDGLDSLKLVEFIANQTKEIIEINKEKDKLLANLERKNQELNEYAHMVSHDLKSPLQSIDALTSWIKDDFAEALGEGGSEIINLIRENVEKMDTLILAILDYSTIGRSEKKLYDVDLNILVNDILLTIENPEDVNVVILNPLPVIKGNQHRLELLFYHLISNAIKFNDKKSDGLVEIKFYEDDENWKFSIKDNGKGIEEQYFGKIFVAFQKLENDYKATGIGLAIVKKIIESYHGKIHLKSTPNKETTFYFTIKK